MVGSPKLTSLQAQQLIHMICYPDGVPELPIAIASSLTSRDDLNPNRAARRRDIARIFHVSPTFMNVARQNRDVIALPDVLQTVDRWRMRVAFLELQLMHKLCQPADGTFLLDSIAECTVEAFTASTRVKRMSGATADKTPLPMVSTDSVSRAMQTQSSACSFLLCCVGLLYLGKRVADRAARLKTPVKRAKQGVAGRGREDPEWKQLLDGQQRARDGAVYSGEVRDASRRCSLRKETLRC